MSSNVNEQDKDVVENFTVSLGPDDGMRLLFTDDEIVRIFTEKAATWMMELQLTLNLYIEY